MHRPGIIALSLALCAGAALLAMHGAGPGARAAPPVTEDAGVPGPSHDREAGGDHWRFDGPNGPVHVWRPAGYRAETAGIVIYLHGYYTHVDRAWSDHALAAQFAASGKNALFIAPEAPAGSRERLYWPSPGELVREVRRQLALPRPWGPMVVMGHSGAYRSIVPWLELPYIDQLVLLDALYGEEEAFRRWYERPGPRPPARLVNIASDTIQWSEPFARASEGAVSFDRVPDPDRAATLLDQEARSAPLVYFRSQIGHMDIVTGGETIPLLLDLTALEAL